MTDKIQTTHAGSLPRPAELGHLVLKRAKGESVSEKEFAEAGSAAREGVVAKQAAAGIDICNDGEQLREAFFFHVKERMTGFGGSWERPPNADIERYPMFKQLEASWEGSGFVPRPQSPMALREVNYIGAAAAQSECSEFSDILQKHRHPFTQAFLTAPSPGIVALAMRNQFYDTEERYLAALGKALRQEYELIHANGFLLQIDAPDLALERHRTYYGRPLKEFQGFVERVIDTINDAISNIPADHVRLHVCWGNYEAPHDCDVDLADILPIIAQAKVGGLVLPFANCRHAHEVRCLGHGALRDDMYVVAGVIDVLTNLVEHPEVVADRLTRVAEVLGDRRRVVAGTDCGFESMLGRGRVAEDVVWAKLASLAEGARRATERLA